MPLFNLLDLFLDETRRGGPEQMALDEALLECADQPMLRIYRWRGDAVTFGYSQSLTMVRERHPSAPFVRRWTGGGIVEHRGDWTFSLVVPNPEPLTKERPRESYRAIHNQVVMALRKVGCAAFLAASHAGANGRECFSSPTIYDVIGPCQRKVCGGAQRRTRRGFLHQGSIQHVPLPSNFALRLARLLARETRPFLICPSVLTRARELTVGRYGTTAWLARVG